MIKMNRRGNIMISLLIFIMALGVMVAFIPVINDFLDLSMQSNAMNCRGYIYNGDVNSPLSFNGSLNNNASGSPIGCLAVKLYLPYLLLVFLVAGISAVLASKAGEMFGFGGQQQDSGYQ